MNRARERWAAPPRFLKPLRAWPPALALLLAWAAFVTTTGCHTALINTTIVNRGPAVHLLEFDYPDASFGIDQLSSGGTFPYRFAITGSGPLKLSFQDGAGRTHTATGPAVHRGQEGQLVVTIRPDATIGWAATLK